MHHKEWSQCQESYYAKDLSSGVKVRSCRLALFTASRLQSLLTKPV
jgi:hypothetical protein